MTSGLPCEHGHDQQHETCREGLFCGSITPKYVDDSRLVLNRAAFHFLNPFEPATSDLRPGCKQGLEDRSEVATRQAVLESPSGMFEHGPAPLIDLLERSPAIKKESNDPKVSATGGPMQSGCTAVKPVEEIGATLQQEFNNVVPAVHAGPEKSILQLLLRGGRLQAAVGLKEGFHEIHLSDASSAFQIEPCPTRSEKLSRARPSVGEAGNHRRVAVAGEIR